MQQRQLDFALEIAARQEPLAHAGDHIRRAPVRRFSRRKGSEGVFWRPVRRADLRILLRAAEKQEQIARMTPGKRGAIGLTGLVVFREMVKLVDYRSGQLDPSYDTLAARTGFARSTIAKALKALRAAGFLDWIRRFDRDPSRAGERGPQVRQVSNAYRFAMPAFIGRLLGVFAHGAPLPEDDEDRRRDHRRDVERMEFEAQYENSPFHDALAKLHATFGKA